MPEPDDKDIRQFANGEGYICVCDGTDFYVVPKELDEETARLAKP